MRDFQHDLISAHRSVSCWLMAMLMAVRMLLVYRGQHMTSERTCSLQCVGGMPATATAGSTLCGLSVHDANST